MHAGRSMGAPSRTARGLTRRDFLRLTGLAAGGAALTACSGLKVGLSGSN